MVLFFTYLIDEAFTIETIFTLTKYLQKLCLKDIVTKKKQAISRKSFVTIGEVTNKIDQCFKRFFLIDKYKKNI